MFSQFVIDECLVEVWSTGKVWRVDSLGSIPVSKPLGISHKYIPTAVITFDDNVSSLNNVWSDITLW